MKPPSPDGPCWVPSIPRGQVARATRWAGRVPASARGDRAGRAGWTRMRRRARKRRRRRRPCREPPAARATSGDVITGTNSHLAQRRFQLPAALPRHRALFRGSPGLTAAPLQDPQGPPWPCNSPATPRGPPWPCNSWQGLHQLDKEGSGAPAAPSSCHSLCSSWAPIWLLGEVWELWVGSRSFLTPLPLSACTPVERPWAHPSLAP